jgi:LmbE family N-acetylglucosaminyl deacetylase
MILVPHADDEALGFGASISKHVAGGDKVHVGILKSSSTDRRTREQNKSASACIDVLKYEQNHFLNIKQQDLQRFNIKALHKIENLIDHVKPNILYIPHYGDAHQEHNNTFNYAKIASRQHRNTAIQTILCGEIISTTGNGFYHGNRFDPNYYNLVTEHDVNQKIKALECYSGELREYPHPRSAQGVMITAQQRGMEAGGMFAEAFVCVRNVIP